MSQPFHFSYSNRYRTWHGLGMNFHQLDIKTKEIMQNRQKEVEKTKNLCTPQKFTIKLVHPVHAHHISQNQFLCRFGIQINIQEKSVNAK